MSVQAPNWYVTQYKNRVMHVYQAKGNKLRPMVAQAGRIEGEKAIFWLAGEGTAYKKQRNTRARPMNPDRSRIEVPLTTWEAFDTVEEYDLDRMNVNEREVVSQAGAGALGRSTDQEIIDTLAANAPTAGDRFIDASAGAFSIVHAMTGVQQLQDSIEEWDGDTYCGLPSLAWNQLMSWKQFASADFVGDDLPYTKMTDTRKWNGVNWFLIPKRYLPVPAANKLDCFMWHKEALGWANNADLSAIWDWDNYMSFWTVNMKVKGAAASFKPTGMLRFRVSTNSAITANG